MKIFGNTNVQGRLSADTGSFKILGTQTGDTIPNVVVAGTDTVDSRTAMGNRSVIAQGQYDFIVTSQDAGNGNEATFNQTTNLPAASVMGYRVQHVDNSTVYTLIVEKEANAATTQSFINSSADGGLSFKREYSIGSIIAFDMAWTAKDVGYVVGATIGVGSDTKVWKKFVNYGLPVTTLNANKSNVTAAVYKKEADSDSFVPWGTWPSDFSDDCITAIAVKPDDENIIIVGTEGGKIHRSIDGGLTWTKVASVGTTSFVINRIKFVTGNSDHVWAVGTNNNIWRSTSAGAENTWLKIGALGVRSGDTKKSVLYTGPNDTIVANSPFDSFNDILLPNVDNAIVVGDDFRNVFQCLNASETVANSLEWVKRSSGIYSNYRPLINIKSIFGDAIGRSKYYIGLAEDKLWVKAMAANQSFGSAQNASRLDWIPYDIPESAIDIQLASSPSNTNGEIDVYAFILTATGIYEFDLSQRKLSGKRSFENLINDSTDIALTLTANSYRELYITTLKSRVIRATKYNYSFTQNFRFIEESSSLSNHKLAAASTAGTGRIYAGSDLGTIIFKDTGSIVDDTTYSTDPVTWTQTATNPTSSDARPNILQLQAIDNLNVYALVQDTGSYSTTLFKSVNSGSTWTNLYTYPTPVRRFNVFDDNNIVALTTAGDQIIRTTSSFAETQIWLLGGDQTIYVSEQDTTEATQKLMLVNRAGAKDYTVSAGTLRDAGPWVDSEWTLCAISGEDGYDFWIGGGTTFTATRGSNDGTSLGSEPLLLRSRALDANPEKAKQLGQGGQTWENYSENINPQEPTDTGGSGGDFTFTSLSEGAYVIGSNSDVFNVYSTTDGTEFSKVNSNLFRDQSTYPGNSDGIRKIRFYDDKFGVAVGDVNHQELSNATSKISITSDGGQNWNYAIVPLEYNFTSVFITTQSLVGSNLEYQIYATAYPVDNSSDGAIFKSSTSGRTWQEIYTLPKSTLGTVYRPTDIFFVDQNSGSFTVQGNIGGSPTIEGVYRTTDGGSTWSFVTISNFAASTTRGHLQFITKTKGYAAGAYSPSYSSGLFKTTDGSTTWIRILTPYSGSVNKPITAMHFVNEATGVISIGNEIWRTVNSGSNWSNVHNLQRILGRDLLPVSGTINEIKFSGNGKLGLAVGFYNANDDTARGEHFVLKSTNFGETWTETDSDHADIDLEFNFDRNRNLIGQPSNLYTIAFAERIVLSQESQSVIVPDPEVPKPIGDCFGSKFMSASYYNFENFAYKCTPSGSKPIYHPNISQNIGLGKGIFGQITSVDRAVLKNSIRYGAALGVNALGKAEDSKGDTATGFGAMDNIKAAANNVAIGYKALSWNTPDTVTNSGGSPSGITTNLYAIAEDGFIYASDSAGERWTLQASEISGSFPEATGSVSGLQFTKIYKLDNNTTLGLVNDLSGSAVNKTYITKYNQVSDFHQFIYSSSVYTIDQLDVMTPSIIFGLDTTNKVFFKSTTGASIFTTGSILNTAGNTLRALKMQSSNLGYIVGSKIWKLQSGSQVNWETSSYSGSHTLNAVDYNGVVWVAVGDSGAVYRSIDRGQNWSYISNGITSYSLKDIKSAGNKMIAVGESGSIIVSNNSGLTWTAGKFIISGSQYPTINQILFLDKNSIILRHTAGFLKSVDGGNNWHDLSVMVLNIVGRDVLSVDGNSLVHLANTRYSNDELSPTRNDASIINPNASGVSGGRTQQRGKKVSDNVAVGAYSLYSFENSQQMVAVGANALKYVGTNNQSIQPNNGETLYGDLYDFVSQQTSSGVPSNYGQVAIGANSQLVSNDSAFNTSVGYATLHKVYNSSYNTAVGFYSQHFSNNDRNTSLGVLALGLNGDMSIVAATGSESSSFAGGDDNVAIGYKALLNNISSNRVKQIRAAGISDPYLGLASLGSRNMAIGNYSLINGNGSIDTIAIGHSAVSLRGSDLTDSVFIGNFVGENFATITGSYYTSSLDNNWRLTQTVAVGSRALQNHAGYDIVAVGANALRGTLTGSNAQNPTTNISTDPQIGILLLGYYNSRILARTKIDKLDTKDWSLSNYKKRNAADRNEYFIYDELSEQERRSGLVAAEKIPVPRDVSIASRNVAYGAMTMRIENPFSMRGAVYPILVKTTELSKASDGLPITWTTVQHTSATGRLPKQDGKPGVIYNAGPLKGDGLTNSLKLNTPDEDTIYLMVGNGTSQYPAFNSRSVLLKSTKVGQFEAGQNFTTLLIGESNEGGFLIKETFEDMHFPSKNHGIIVAHRPATSVYPATFKKTTNGGTVWESGSIDASVSGSGVRITSVWMNPSGSVAYAAGTHGSIYKWTTETGWVKQLGASNSTNFYGSINGAFWSSVLMTEKIAGVSTTVTAVEYFQNKVNLYQSNVFFLDIQFLDDNIGYAIGKWPNFVNPVGRTGAGIGYNLLIAKTTDGGVTWDFKGVRQTSIDVTCKNKQYGGARTALGETTPFPWGELVVIDENKAVIGMSYATMAFTTDGGNTWKFDTNNVFQVGSGANGNAQCDPYPIIWCGDYKKFDEVTTITTSSALPLEIIETVTVGSDAQPKQTTVTNNVAVGYKVQFETTGSAVKSVQIGSKATLRANEVENTVAIGNDTLPVTKYSYATTAVGADTLNMLQADKENPPYPVFLSNGLYSWNADYDGIYTSSKSEYNTVVGFESGWGLKQGGSNVFLGYNSGIGYDINTGQRLTTFGDNNIIIGANSKKTTPNQMNQIAIGNDQSSTAILWGVYNVPNPWTIISDGRDKTNTGSFSTGLSFIRELNVKSFKWDARAFYPSGSTPNGSRRFPSSSYGFIAQDVESAATTAGLDTRAFVIETTGSNSDYSGSFPVKAIVPGMIDLMVYNAVKELDTEIQSSKYAVNVGDGVNTAYTITHNLGTRDIVTSVIDNFTNYVVYPSMSVTSSNAVVVTFPTVASSGQYRFIAIK